MVKLKPIRTILILFFIVTRFAICQDQVQVVEDDINKIRLSIMELKAAIEKSHKELLNKISEMNKATEENINRLTIKQNSLKKEYDNILVSQRDIEEQLLNSSREINDRIESLNENYSSLVENLNIIDRNTKLEMQSLKRDISLKFILISSAVILLIVFTLVIVFFLKGKIKSSSFLEESLKLDSEMSEILKNQLVLLKSHSDKRDSDLRTGQMKHSLPIRVGEEIFRMRKRIKNMDKNIKGINSLKNSLSRLEDEFNSQGYSIRDLTGQSYQEELTVKVVNAIENKDLEKGKKIIHRMITPQIFYKDIVINHGEAELIVSEGDSK